MSDKWGPSVGLPQIRTLRDPTAWGPLDVWRDADKLRQVDYQAAAAYAISKNGTDFTPWSVYRSGSYLPHKGKDYIIRTGHERAHLWDN